jgi:SH3-like domain-containing protein
MRKVLRAYEIAYPNALCVRKGESLRILREETNPAWAGWLWCRSDDGQEGWVSKDYLVIDGERGVLKLDYDAREVAVAPLEIVEVLREERGWCWVRKQDGAEGWVPGEVFSPE